MKCVRSLISILIVHVEFYNCRIILKGQKPKSVLRKAVLNYQFQLVNMQKCRLIGVLLKKALQNIGTVDLHIFCTRHKLSKFFERNFCQAKSSIFVQFSVRVCFIKMWFNFSCKYLTIRSAK